MRTSLINPPHNRGVIGTQPVISPIDRSASPDNIIEASNSPGCQSQRASFSTSTPASPATSQTEKGKRSAIRSFKIKRAEKPAKDLTATGKVCLPGERDCQETPE
ncbi:hypothetical protein Baya_6714 [Bagarius yarrelli]|uniref:Uncharacterized protein n=1 Tax=Bagarius yarrelli TaxID=175774 RepID=A0A556U1P8_BAGYA|nr:hypothetical protein Baya_6714 [Bagarius yarrelli]